MLQSMVSAKKTAIFGSGPAGLMAATRLVRAGAGVTVFERRPSFGRKLLIAGSSGLNISHEASVPEFIAHYEGFSPPIWSRFFSIFSPKDWIAFVESLGFETFVGTSSRYFVREMKASNLLRAWIEMLKKAGVQFVPNTEFNSETRLSDFDSVGFFLGGGSWEDREPVWPAVFRERFGIQVHPFSPSNVGYEVAWNPKFLQEAEGKPLKNIVFTTKSGSKAGELVVTGYGLEGTPIYFHGTKGVAFLDLKPALTQSSILEKLKSVRENLSPLRRIKKVLGLNETALALLFHHTEAHDRENLGKMVSLIKRFPLEILRPRPLMESISSKGGVDLGEVRVDPGCELMLKKHPGFFCGGEMLDWDAPTGGFLIQASVTQGAVAARGMLGWMENG
ncbi:MAG: TIGR03862 family flavoprotein [Bdellovibrionales bacterium]|nr:TIGR03862 family flavoprotein [Bdellovibrionales bacterium]